MSLYYEDAGLRLFHGSNKDILPTLPDAFYDSIVTDPPYELGFMGKGWDSTGIAYDVEMWRECFRVLKPGGYLLSFGGTRTWHRIAAAIEDAGFEIRDSIAWMYGSGFPKSMDVAKAIDKQRHDAADKLRVTTYFADIAASNGVTRADVDAHMGTSDMGGWWLSRIGRRCAIPTLDQIPRLLEALQVTIDDVPADIRSLIVDLNGAKGQPGAAWFEREVVGAGYRVDRHQGHVNYGSGTPEGHYDITAPATDAAKEWEGWGTALKPAFEPIIVARKPLGGQINVRARVEAELRARGVEGEIRWSTGRVQSVEARQQQAAQSATPAGASVTRRSASANESSSGDATASGVRRTASMSARATGNATANSAPQSSPRTGANASAAESGVTSSSRSTTSTGVAQRTAEPSTARSMPSSDASDTPMDTESFAGIATGLTGSLTHVRIRRNADGSFGWPADLPEVVTVGSTVAANVLAYGTGAINIDACRVAFTSAADKASAVPQGRATAKVGALAGKAQEWVSASTSATEPSTTASMTDTRASSTITESAPSAVGTARTEFTPKQDDRGRFPSNVLLDESQAAELDRQAPNTGGAGKASGPTLTGKSTSVARGQFNGVDDSPFYADRGGASRFFPTFRYEAKAPGSERPEVDGVAHATVKPLELMRWLVRLVTRPGGRVLEPFAGSGTTGEAALLEGMEVDLIELEADHLPLILQRVRKPLQPSLFGDLEAS